MYVFIFDTEYLILKQMTSSLSKEGRIQKVTMAMTVVEKYFRLALLPNHYFVLDPKLCPNTNSSRSIFFKERLSWNLSKLKLFKTIIYQIHFNNRVNSSNSMIVSILFCLTHFVCCYCGRVEGLSRC